MPSRYDRYSELVLTESIALLDIDDKELPKSVLDICLWMLCLAKEDANPANPFFFDLASGCRANNGILWSLYFIFKKRMCCIKANILNHICIMNYPTINSFDFLCGHSTGNSDFSHSLKTNLQMKWLISVSIF